MLVLARKRDEKIYVGDDVVIHVLETRSDGSVKLGFEAPRSVRIQRAELVDAVAAENEAAILSGELLPSLVARLLSRPEA